MGGRCARSWSASVRLAVALHRFCVAPLLLIATVAAPVCAAVSGGDAGAFKVGFDVRNTPAEDARQYQPFLEYLGKATGYRFELRFTRKGENIVDLLGTGAVEFALVGAQSYLEARARFGVTPLARGLNREGKAEYQSAIVTKRDSPIRTVGDLRGRSFAFGSRTSTQGFLIPLIVFAENGLDLDALARHSFTGSHRNCAQAVLRGESDAGGMQDILAKEYADAGLLRIVQLSRFYPSSGVAAGRQVPGEVVRRVKQALLDFRPQDRHAKGLYHWDKTEMPNGFVAADDADYAELRAYALKFGLLGASSP